MKTLYIECKMGVAGDMLLGALYEICPQQDKFLEIMKQLFDNKVEILPLSDTTCGIHGTHMRVRTDAGIEGSSEEHSHSHSHSGRRRRSSHGSHEHHEGHHHHHHVSYASILEQIEKLPLREDIRAHAAAIYKMIGEAESKVHDTTIDQIHFHEVGTLDALADVTGVCLLLAMIAPEQILCSSIHVGNGTVECAHGTLPVPAPATAELLSGIPYYTGEIEDELCTPTGAALVKYFAGKFCAMPEMSVDQVGIGIGSKKFETANMVRVFLGDSFSEESDVVSNHASAFETADALEQPASANSLSDAVSHFDATVSPDEPAAPVAPEFAPGARIPEENAPEKAAAPAENGTAKTNSDAYAGDIESDADCILDLSCNIDDMTGEDLGFAMEQLLNEGALDVFCQPIQMKKNRPGVLLHCFCDEKDKDRFIRLMFAHTTTRGLRYQSFHRCKLSSVAESRETAYGTIRYKISEGNGVRREKPEYEDLKRAALENGQSILEIRNRLSRES